MDSAMRHFDKRRKAVSAKHRKLARGYTNKLNRNGVIEHKPIRRMRFLSAKGLLLAAMGFVGFKAYLYANLGDADYHARIGQLSNGTAVERAGAMLMSTDPATLWIASKIPTGQS